MPTDQSLIIALQKSGLLGEKFLDSAKRDAFLNQILSVSKTKKKILLALLQRMAAQRDRKERDVIQELKKSKSQMEAIKKEAKKLYEAAEKEGEGSPEDILKELFN